MKVTVNKDLSHMFDGWQLNKGNVLKVEHFSYGIFYTIKEPLEFSGTTIHKDDFTEDEGIEQEDEKMLVIEKWTKESNGTITHKVII